MAMEFNPHRDSPETLIAHAGAALNSAQESLDHGDMAKVTEFLIAAMSLASTAMSLVMLTAYRERETRRDRA